MSGFSYRILVVDDDETIRNTSSMVLASKGFEVRTAADGFQAPAELRKSPPDLIISDLRMPNMSGFELLSVVRRRLPYIPVIAISGEFNGTFPEGLIADHFFRKGAYSPDALFERIADLISRAPLRPNTAKLDQAPVWIPRNAEGYFVLTCTECLRSFSLPSEEAAGEVRSSTCPFCSTTVRFLADPSQLNSRKK